MSKKTTGIDDLIRTMIRQHGLETAIRCAREQMLELPMGERGTIWAIAYRRMKDMRP